LNIEKYLTDLKNLKGVGEDLRKKIDKIRISLKKYTQASDALYRKSDSGKTNKEFLKRNQQAFQRTKKSQKKLDLYLQVGSAIQESLFRNNGIIPFISL